MCLARIVDCSDALDVVCRHVPREDRFAFVLTSRACVASWRRCFGAGSLCTPMRGALCSVARFEWSRQLGCPWSAWTADPHMRAPLPAGGELVFANWGSNVLAIKDGHAYSTWHDDYWTHDVTHVNEWYETGSDRFWSLEDMAYKVRPDDSNEKLEAGDKAERVANLKAELAAAKERVRDAERRCGDRNVGITHEVREAQDEVREAQDALWRTTAEGLATDWLGECTVLPNGIVWGTAYEETFGRPMAFVGLYVAQPDALQCSGGLATHELRVIEWQGDGTADPFWTLGKSGTPQSQGYTVVRVGSQHRTRLAHATAGWYHEPLPVDDYRRAIWLPRASPRTAAATLADDAECRSRPFFRPRTERCDDCDAVHHAEGDAKDRRGTRRETALARAQQKRAAATARRSGRIASHAARRGAPRRARACARSK